MTSRLLTAAALLAALASPAHADYKGSDDNIELIIALVIAVPVILGIFVLVTAGKSYGRKQDDAWNRKHHPERTKPSAKDFPTARVVEPEETKH